LSIQALPSVPSLLLALLGGMFAAAWLQRRRSLPLADRVDAVLPQTQCRQCGYDGCRPYAEAIAAGTAAINRCPPGGARVIRRLAARTGRPALPLDPSCGEHKPPRLARIDEARCIGCTLCIQACPVDAILGAPKLMHTVIAELCTGCELCLPPCPVDCIDLVPAASPRAGLLPGRRGFDADAARIRHRQRKQRLERQRLERTARLAAKAEVKLAALEHGSDDASARKRAIVQAALERARAKLAAARSNGAEASAETVAANRRT
jgi:electron transport complex protein RnfB